MLPVSLGELGVAMTPRRPQSQFASERERKLQLSLVQEQMEAQCRELQEQNNSWKNLNGNCTRRSLCNKLLRSLSHLQLYQLDVGL